MSDGFHSKQDWWGATLALAVWAAHFTLAWAASIALTGQPAARWIGFALTLAAFVGLRWLWNWRNMDSLASVAGLGVAIAVGGIAFSGIAAIIG